MGITQKDIAKDMGISLITVSRALNNSGYVSEELRKRIFDYARERAYVPHKASQALVRNKALNIALFSSSLPAYFWHDIKKGIEIAAEQIRPFNYNVRYHMIPESDTECYLGRLRKELTEGLDGAAFVNQRLYDMKAIVAELDRAGIPYVSFNVDAPETGRLCHIGSDYRAGGRLAANYIGGALRTKGGGRVLVIGSNEDEDRVAKRPDINAQRYSGFTAVLRDRFPETSCEVEYVTTKLRIGYIDDQIEHALAKRRDSIDAVYLIPAFNELFLTALEKLAFPRALTVLHDMDRSAAHHLQTGTLSAVVHQNPILQGYFAVKTLEHLLESKRPERVKDVEIVHNLVFAENRDLHRNHYGLSELME